MSLDLLAAAAAFVPKGTANGRKKRARVAIQRRAAGKCEAGTRDCLYGLPLPDRCSFYAPFLHYHHRQRRFHDGPFTVDNIILVCENCHRYIHWPAHEEEALRAGWLVDPNTNSGTNAAKNEEET
jgi:hypothetical protein